MYRGRVEMDDDLLTLYDNIIALLIVVDAFLSIGIVFMFGRTFG